MPRRFRKSLAVSLVAATAVAGAATYAAPLASAQDTAAAADANVVPGAYVALFAPGHDAAREAPVLARREGVQLGHVYGTVSGFSFKGSAQKAEALRRNPNIARVDADQRMAAAAEPPPAGVARVRQPEASATGDAGAGAGATIAVIDTGVDVDHPEFANSFLNSGTAGFSSVTTNEKGIVGKDCVANDGKTSFDDDQYHGTHVAGTAAAPVDDFGVVGVAPKAKIVPVKVLDSNGSGSWSDIVCGINFVAENATKITVANMSLGGSGSAGAGCSASTMRSAICTAVGRGVAFIVAAGNSTADAAGFVPAAYPEVIAVSAIDVTTNALASFSNYGTVVDVTAPGVAVYSTIPVERGSYGNLNGTSMASPHAAGVAAIALLRNPALKPSNVSYANELLRSMRSMGTCNGGDAVSGSCGTKWGNEKDTDNEPLVDALNVATSNVSAPAPAPDAAPAPTPAGQLVVTAALVNNKFWTATAKMSVTDPSGAAVSGVTIVGDWTGRYAASGRSCVTDATGTCSIGTPSLDRKTVPSETFTVTSATKSGTAYTFSPASGMATKV